jgi:serine/threonine protein kinase
MACLNCGFELVEDGERCAACGAGSTLADTNVQPMDAMPTMRRTVVDPHRLAVRALRGGDVFAGRYEIVSPLGRGGMGVVYRARDLEEGRERALKILHTTADDDHAAVRFRREIEILSRIDHPNIVRISDWGVEGGRMYFAADLIEGDDLRVVLRRRNVLPVVEVAEIGSTLAGALGAAHSYGIVHRDIKPHNVMIGPDGRLTLLDFGIARGAGIEMNTVTATGVMIGTPEYMSPEQFQGLRVDARSDLYSMGVVLYELLTGALPFQGDTPVSLGIRHQTVLPPPIRTQRPNVPAWLERTIMRCLEKDPGRRFASAAELAAELTRVREGERRERALANGDVVIEDDSESEAWALTLVSADQRLEWTCGMALEFEQRFYRLDDVRSDGAKWFYRFAHWPEEEVLRKVVDYEADIAERTGTAACAID